MRQCGLNFMSRPTVFIYAKTCPYLSARSRKRVNYFIVRNVMHTQTQLSPLPTRNAKYATSHAISASLSPVRNVSYISSAQLTCNQPPTNLCHGPSGRHPENTYLDTPRSPPTDADMSKLTGQVYRVVNYSLVSFCFYSWVELPRFWGCGQEVQKSC